MISRHILYVSLLLCLFSIFFVEAMISKSLNMTLIWMNLTINIFILH
jgi:hypothetical protein